MRDTRDPEQLGKQIKRYVQLGYSPVAAADHACPPLKDWFNESSDHGSAGRNCRVPPQGGPQEAARGD